jgi:molecular chaperone GrpE
MVDMYHVAFWDLQFAIDGVRKFCEVPGDVFDSAKHEALMEYLDPSKEPGTVGQVIKAGFTLNDRVLRPAEVGVVKKE